MVPPKAGRGEHITQYRYQYKTRGTTENKATWTSNEERTEKKKRGQKLQTSSTVPAKGKKKKNGENGYLSPVSYLVYFKAPSRDQHLT